VVGGFLIADRDGRRERSHEAVLDFGRAAFVPVCIAWSLSMIFAAKADIKIERKASSVSISISGTITGSDAKEFQNVSQELEYKELSVLLDSKGGDVSAAMQIGRLIRKYDGTTLILQLAPWITSNVGRPRYDRCYSSCALIFIAGVHRVNDGELGLHRPFFASAPQSRETLEKQVPLMLSMVKSYIVEMGITENFYQQMVNTEPSKIVIYNSNNYQKIVPAIDPVFAEIEVAREARRYGTTTSGMRQRQAEAKQEPCKFYDVQGLSDKKPDCAYSAYWGLSERIYRERNAKAKEECWFSNEREYSDIEDTALKQTPRKLRDNLPFVIRVETCVRNVMLGK
jgi:hypothetical protein